MEIVLVGTGKTGAVIERLAQEMGHRIVGRFNSSAPLLANQSAQCLNGDAVLIDFSKPNLALPHIAFYCERGLRVVMGTTGWHERLSEVEQWMRTSESCLLHAPNFSIGVAVFSRFLDQAARAFNGLPSYDVALHEMHHRLKHDSPSGTAVQLANMLVHNLDRKNKVSTETQHQRIDANDLHVTSQRVGHVFGRHTITFDSPYDQITLSHEAKSRDGFAYGAIRAAEWIVDKKGLFTLDDLLTDWLGEAS